MKNIKKIIAIVIGYLIIMNCMPVYASINFDKTTSSDEQEMINKREEYADEVNDILLSYALEAEEIAPIDGDYINFDKMVKFYYNVDLLKKDAVTHDIMKIEIKDKEYDYSLPVIFDDATVMMDIRIEKPLTEEEYELYDEELIEFYENRVGTWVVKSKSVYGGVDDYKADIEKLLKKNNITDCYVYCLADFTYSVNMAAIICTDNPDDTRFIVLDQMLNAEDMELDRETLYTLDEMKNFAARENELLEEMIAQEGDDGPYFGGGLSDTSTTHQSYNAKIIIIASVAGAVLLATVVTIVCVVNKKRKAKNIES